jgi:TrmH family RNA methyltransferase
MLSKSHLKLIQNLRSKKQRIKNGLFIAEGEKIIQEVLASNVKVKTIFSTDGHLFENNQLYPDQLVEIDELTLKEISSLISPSKALGIFEIPKIQFDTSIIELCLDEIQDPGNLGTIIRIADWYGITKIHCKKGTVDLYNPKVIQASMGSFMRVQVNYVDDLADFLSSQNKPIFGTFMDGENLHELSIPKEALIVIGNEGIGISSEVEQHCSHKITIPRFGEAESLNAGIATAIILDNFIR